MVTIERFTHEDAELWTRAGRLFADAKIRKELGRSLTSAPGFVWWLALDDGKVVGIAALSPRPKHCAELRHAYVMETHRKQGIYNTLLNARIEYARGLYDQLITTATNASRHALEKAGFAIYGQRGRYAQMKKDL